VGEIGSFLAVTAAIVVLVGGGILVFAFSWFARHGGRVEVKQDRRSVGGMLAPLAGLFIIAGILAGFFRLLRPYLH
jgi:hypothetical protein